MSGPSSVRLLYQHMITSLNGNGAGFVQRRIHFYRDRTRYHVVEDVRRGAKCHLGSAFGFICRSEPQPSSRPPPFHRAKMSITSDEVNFLVYRYLQESGLSPCPLLNTNMFTYLDLIHPPQTELTMLLFLPF